MGQIHNELRRGDLSSALKRVVGDTREGGLERYGETLQPVLDLWLQPEWAFSRGEFLWAYNDVTAAGAEGEESFNAILNPAGSGNLVIVERAFNRSGIVVGMMFLTQAALKATGTITNPPQNRDTRWQRNPTIAGSNPPVEVWDGSDPTFPLNSLFDVAAAGAEFLIALPVVLRPGTALVFQGATAATQIEVLGSGRVRRAQTGELG